MTIIADRARWTLPATLERAADRFGGRAFLSFAIGSMTALTYEQLAELSGRVAGGLRALGCDGGDRVLIMLPNRAEFVLSWFGANTLGAVQVPVNVEYRGEFLEHVANTAEAAIVVVDGERLPALAASLAALRSLRHVITVDGAAEGAASLRGVSVTTFDELLAAPPAPRRAVATGELAAIHFTSGTTGRSKGSMMPHAQQHLLSEQNCRLVGLGSDDVYFTSLPLFHVNAQATAVYAAMLVGASVHLEPRFSASRWLELIRSTGATVTTTLGVMMQFILAVPARAQDADNRLRCVWAVPCPPPLAKQFAARFGVEQFAMPYGNTEVGMVTDPRSIPPTGSCGRPDERYFEVALVDPQTDEPVAVGEVGEVVVRPRVPWVITSGYFGMPERTVESFRNAWFHTGDSLRADADGWLWFVDRIKDRIRRRGENIASADVEEVLERHPAVREAAVIAVPSEIPGGEDELKACLVLVPACPLAEVIAWSEQQLPGFAVPRYFEALDALPKTPTAKVRKELLRDASITSATVDREAMSSGPG